MTKPESIRDLLPGYVLGALDDDEKRLVDEWLTAAAGSEEGAKMDRELSELTRQLEVLADEIPPERPSETTRARLMRSVGESAGPPAPRRAEWMPWAAAGALFLIAATLGWQNFTLRGVVADLAAGRDRVEVELANLRTELERARATSVRLAAAQRIVAAPDTARVLLAGLEDAPAAAGSTYSDPQTGRAVFYAANLPQLAADQTYQLWFIGGEGPVSGGIFAVDDRGDATVLVDDVLPPGEIAAWAVTIEPAGGVPQPTGAMVLKG